MKGIRTTAKGAPDCCEAWNCHQVARWVLESALTGAEYFYCTLHKNRSRVHRLEAYTWRAATDADLIRGPRERAS